MHSLACRKYISHSSISLGRSSVISIGGGRLSMDLYLLRLCRKTTKWGSSSASCVTNSSKALYTAAIGLTGSLGIGNWEMPRTHMGGPHHISLFINWLIEWGRDLAWILFKFNLLLILLVCFILNLGLHLLLIFFFLSVSSPHPESFELGLVSCIDTLTSLSVVMWVGLFITYRLCGSFIFCSKGSRHMSKMGLFALPLLVRSWG